MAVCQLHSPLSAPCPVWRVALLVDWWLIVTRHICVDRLLCSGCSELQCCVQSVATQLAALSAAMKLAGHSVSPFTSAAVAEERVTVEWQKMAVARLANA